MNKERILIVEVNWLGDVLFSTPFIRAVRNNFPDAFIACMIVPGVRDVLEGNPHINEIITYNVGANGSSPMQDLRENIKFVKILKAYNFDTVFFLHRSFTRTLLCCLAGIPERIGYYTLKRAFLLTKRFKASQALSLHRARFYLRLAERVGLKIDEKGCDFFVDKKDLEWAKGVKAGQKTVVLNPGANWLPKRWPKENFIEFGKLILLKFGDNVKIIITGSSKDLDLGQQINSGLSGKAVVLCGELSLKQSAAIFKTADLVVSADSGPLHIAVSVGAKAVGIFGPTSPFITGPYMADNKKVIILHKDKGCKIPCYDGKCDDYKCMFAITAQEAFDAAERLLQ